MGACAVSGSGWIGRESWRPGAMNAKLGAMTESGEGRGTTRRGFVRLATGLGLGSAALSAGACLERDSGRGAGPDAPDGGAMAAAAPLIRPTLRPWADDIVWMSTPSDEPPVAYVSMETRRVFVDRDYRDRVAWLLDAHISVSTALWRIPLPGDPGSEPITPGDALREFEEVEIRDWSPTMRPSMDDIRIRRGRSTLRRVELRCVPLAGREAPRVDSPLDSVVGEPEAWCSAGPWEISVADESPVGAIREEFMIVGTGLCHLEPACPGSGNVIQLVGWAARRG